MNKSILADILRTFSKTEIHELKEIIRSPFYNKNKNLIKLFDFISRAHPDFKKAKLDKRIIYKYIFSNDQYNDSLMRSLIFNLTKLCEEYLTVINYSRNPLKKRIGLLDELIRRRLDKSSMKTLKLCDFELSKAGIKNDMYFYNKFILSCLKSRIIFTKRYSSKNLKSYNEANMIEGADSLSNFYLINAIDRYCHLLFYKKTVKLDINYPLIERIFELIIDMEDIYPDNLLLKIHVYEARLMKEEKPDLFYSLKDILINEEKALDSEVKTNMFVTMFHFLNSRLYNGEYNYYKEMCELYNIGMKQSLIISGRDEYIDLFTYINAVKAGLYTNNYKWVKRLIKDLQNYIVPDYRDLISKYANSLLAFAQNNFELALDFLNSIKSLKRPQFKTYIKNQCLKIYYELSMYDTGFSQADSHRHFLMNLNKQVSDIILERHRNFLKCYNKLLKAKENESCDSLLELQKYIDRTFNISEREWLLKKNQELLNQI